MCKLTPVGMEIRQDRGHLTKRIQLQEAQDCSEVMGTVDTWMELLVTRVHESHD